MFGLLYHLENPIGALRLAHALTARICLIETQVTPNLSGVTDWGSYQFTKRMRGAFAVIDEGGEEDRPESSLTGLSLCPSKEALVWLLKHLGFRRVEVVPPPQDAYEQLASGKRVVVAAYR